MHHLLMLSAIKVLLHSGVGIHIGSNFTLSTSSVGLIFVLDCLLRIIDFEVL